MKYGVISVLFIFAMIVSAGSSAGEKDCSLHLVDSTKTEADIKALTDSKCPAICKGWLCTTGGHGSYVGRYSKVENWRTAGIYEVFCRCHFDY